jgi:CRP-like cAMP-binding protein
MEQLFKSYIESKDKVSDEVFKSMFSLLVPLHVCRGTILLEQGAVCTQMILVAKGCLRSFVTDSRGKQHILSFAPENWWIGEHLSFTRGTPAMFSIDAVEDADVLLADKSFFEKMPAIYAGFHLHFIDYLLEYQRAVEKHLLYLLGAFGDERYRDFTEAYPELAARLPQYMIASYLGISPETLSRIRARLAQK